MVAFYGFPGLYWAGMLSPRRHPRRPRAVSLVVAVVQLASVTWVPIVHPLIHPDRTLIIPLSSVDTPTSGEEQLVLGEVMCVACMVSPVALPSPRGLLPAQEFSRRQPATRQCAKWHPLQSFNPTPPARAPPAV
jgi:hypothetical protein